MHLTDIETLHAQHVRPGFGTTTPDELDYIQRLIVQHRPKRFIEIGTASGLTTGFIARFMAENGGTSVTSIDLSAKFFGNASTPIGYLATQIFDGAGISIDIHPRTSALDLERLEGPWDMAFIDANHQHPWPTLDTLALAPFLCGSRILIHHDLQLYRRHKTLHGIGPRVLFNEMPETHRHADIANGWNIYSLDLTMTPTELEEAAIGALCMPWTSRPSLSSNERTQFEAILSRSYSPHVLSEFRQCCEVNRDSAMMAAAFATRRAIAQTLETLGLRKR